MDSTMTETLPAASPTYISELLLFQQIQVICLYTCSVDISCGVDFRETRQTVPRVVAKATVFSSGDIATREATPSCSIEDKNNN